MSAEKILYNTTYHVKAVSATHCSLQHGESGPNGSICEVYLEGSAKIREVNLERTGEMTIQEYISVMESRDRVTCNPNLIIDET